LPSVRAPLPSDPRTTDPLDPAFDSALANGLAELGLTLDPDVMASLEAHARLLVAWNAAINLTAIGQPDRIARLHVCDSLSALPTLRRMARARPSLLDLGSGGGYPGLTLAAALRVSRAALVESVVKKARFLEVAAHAVSEALRAGPRPPPLIEAFAERAEDLAEEADNREAYDIVTARAVGSLAEVAELGLPFLRNGGLLVVWKRGGAGEPSGRLGEELRLASSIVRAVGGGRPTLIDVPGPSLAGHVLCLIRKERPSPPDYPRQRSVRRARSRGLMVRRR
jgi:16S rRNA (guanine527-N7)-methyltransferase